jgi:hypothetical protein
MIESVARVATPQPERYIKQIVSHLGHRLSTRLDEDGAGVVAFESGQCMLTAGEGVLLLAANAPDVEALSRVRDVLGRHLERFGGRERPRCPRRRAGCSTWLRARLGLTVPPTTVAASIRRKRAAIFSSERWRSGCW